jgi:hypothetical protein
MTGPVWLHNAPDFPNAECAKSEVNPEWFYAADSNQPNWQEVELAISICKVCTHELDCLQYAITNKEDYGIWGSLTALQRKRLREKNGTASRVHTNIPRKTST